MTSLLQPDEAGLDTAAAILRAGGLVAFGTETVYGLGADATQDRAVACIFEAKGRPHFNPLICHFPDAAAAFAQVVPTGAALALQGFWPGPLTLVLPRRVTSGVALLAGAGLDTLAVRVPAHPIARALAARLGRPIAAPSANRSGRISPVTAAHVLEELGGRIDAILDCGPCAVGLESTVVDVTGAAVVLRPGGVPTGAIAQALGYAPGRAITPEEAQATRALRSPRPADLPLRAVSAGSAARGGGRAARSAARLRPAPRRCRRHIPVECCGRPRGGGGKPVRRSSRPGRCGPCAKSRGDRGDAGPGARPWRGDPRPPRARSRPPRLTARAGRRSLGHA